MEPLIDPDTLTEIQALHEQSMKSLCRVYTRARVEDDRGGSVWGAWTLRPQIKAGICAVTYGGTQRQETVIGERLQSLSDAVVSLPLGSVADSDDEIEADITVAGPVGPITTTERYRVVGDPGNGSYSTAYSVAVQKVS